MPLLSLHRVGEPPSSVGKLEVVREDTKFFISWEEPVVTNGGITDYTVNFTVLGSAGNLLSSVNHTVNVSNTSRAALCVTVNLMQAHVQSLRFYTCTRSMSIEDGACNIDSLVRTVNLRAHLPCRFYLLYLLPFRKNFV